jgi:hypothetical protein
VPSRERGSDSAHQFADDRIRHAAGADADERIGDRALVPRELWSGARPHGWIVGETFAACVASPP